MAPRLIAELIDKQLIDYLAIDLKTSPERYPELHSGVVSPDKLVETLRLCADAPVEVEYRTTCVPGWVDEDVISTLGELINGARLWALQQYHPEHALCEKAQKLNPYSVEQVQSFAEIAGNYAQKVIVRGV